MQRPSKEVLRRALLEKRALLDEGERTSAGKTVAERFFSRFPEAEDVGLYWAIQGEFPTEGILTRLLSEGKRAYLPRVLPSGGLEFAIVEQPFGLVPGPFGIQQPKPEQVAVALDRIPLLLVPGVAFDSRGSRIGWGKGYYDAILKGYGGQRLALAYDFQVLEEVPTEEHDERMDAIWTERRAIECRNLKVETSGRKT